MSIFASRRLRRRRCHALLPPLVACLVVAAVVVRAAAVVVVTPPLSPDASTVSIEAEYFDTRAVPRRPVEEVWQMYGRLPDVSLCDWRVTSSGPYVRPPSRVQTAPCLDRNGGGVIAPCPKQGVPQVASGPGYVQSAPECSLAIYNNATRTFRMPRLDYRITFPSPGRYYLWARGYTPDPSYNITAVRELASFPNTTYFREVSPMRGSLRSGVDSDSAYWAWDACDDYANRTCFGMFNDFGKYPSHSALRYGESHDWAWQAPYSGQRFIDVGDASLTHTLHLFVREGGLILDKFFLTTDEQWPAGVLPNMTIPTGAVPAHSLPMPPLTVLDPEPGDYDPAAYAPAPSEVTMLPPAAPPPPPLDRCANGLLSCARQRPDFATRACATSACTWEECCEPTCCLGQRDCLAPFSECGAGADGVTLLAPLGVPAAHTCADDGGACTPAHCCGTSCAGFECPAGFYSLESTLACVTPVCGRGECCGVNPSCSSIRCPTGFSRLPPSDGAPARCAGAVCAPDECCRENARCAVDFACPSAAAVRANATLIQCAATACLADECCVVEGTCSTLNCALVHGLLQRSGSLSIPCASAPCTADECCASPPTCGAAFECAAPAWQARENMAALPCAALTCTVDDCCAAMPSTPGGSGSASRPTIAGFDMPVVAAAAGAGALLIAVGATWYLCRLRKELKRSLSRQDALSLQPSNSAASITDGAGRTSLSALSAGSGTSLSVKKKADGTYELRRVGSGRSIGGSSAGGSDVGSEHGDGDEPGVLSAPRPPGPPPPPTPVSS